MYAGCGYAGDFAGDPLAHLALYVLVWTDDDEDTLRARWSAVSLPAGTTFILYRAGTILQRGITAGDAVEFAPVTPGVLPAVAAVGIPAALAGETSYDPLHGSVSAANMTVLSELVSFNLRGLYRIEDTSLEVYELYAGEGVGVAPDFDAPPLATSATLPLVVDMSAYTTAGAVLNFVLRKRNRHDLSSQNISTTTIVIAAGGAEVNAPSAPTFEVAQAAAGAVLVSARYDYLADEEAVRATTWAVWLTSDGSTPNPAGAATYTEVMSFSDGIARLDWTSATQTDGATIKVLVRTRRAGTPNVDSINTAPVTILADASGPLAPVAGAFLGEAARQQ